MQQHDHFNHHLHDLNTVHYDVSTHDDYRRHHHEWAGNQFNTVHDDDGHADDYELTTPGDDHLHCGFDLHWPNDHSRTTPATPTAAAAG